MPPVNAKLSSKFPLLLSLLRLQPNILAKDRETVQFKLGTIFVFKRLRCTFDSPTYSHRSSLQPVVLDVLLARTAPKVLDVLQARVISHTFLEEGDTE
ncbi:hypothetical protein BS78_10G096600 [Paspalum vaginatum]|nr:hypothetical protein BS78_10G096600 [Paspalum vaginatum]